MVIIGSGGIAIFMRRANVEPTFIRSSFSFRCSRRPTNGHLRASSNNSSAANGCHARISNSAADSPVQFREQSWPAQFVATDNTCEDMNRYLGDLVRR